MAVPPVKLTLGIVYTLLVVYLSLDVFAASLSAHKKRSFRMGFVCLLTVWTANRAIFWLYLSFQNNHNSLLELFLFWMPLPIQSATFSFLLLYYCKVIWMNEWDAARRGLQMAYVLCNGAIFVVTAAWACVAVYAPFEWSGRIWLIFNSGVFFLLSFSFALATYHLTRNGRPSVKQLPIVHAPLVNCTIFLCFLSRSAIDMMEVAFYSSKFREKCCALSMERDKDLSFTALLLYTFWEFIPTILTMLFVANAAGNFAVANLLCSKTKAQRRFIFDKETGEYIDVAAIAASAADDGPAIYSGSDEGLLGNYDIGSSPEEIGDYSYLGEGEGEGDFFWMPPPRPLPPRPLPPPPLLGPSTVQRLKEDIVDNCQQEPQSRWPTASAH